MSTLAMPQEELDIIKAITHKATQTAPQQEPQKEPQEEPQESSSNIVSRLDHIEHKSESRVVILHGVPGLGKTYTVECVAEFYSTFCSTE
jgi:signal recognition particle GTPase